MIRSVIRSIRIVSPLSRAKEQATLEEAQPNDVIEIADLPVYGVNPQTYESTTSLQRFLVGRGGSLKPIQR